MARKRGIRGVCQRASDGLWVASITVKGKRLVKYAKTQREAAVKLDELKAMAAGGLPQARKDITVEVLMAEYLAEKQPTWSLQSYVSAEQQSRLHILPHLGHVRLSDLDARTVAAWLRKMPRARHTQLARDHLLSACAMAVRWEWLTRNPVELTEPVKVTRSRPAEMSREQLREILEATKGCRYHAAVCIGLGCGLRPSETLGLTWDKWDESMGTLSIERQILWLPGTEAQLAQLKTKSSRRTVTLPAFATAALVLHRAAQDAERAARLAQGKEWENGWGLMFTGLRGQPVRQQGLNAAMNQSLAAAGIEHLTPHKLRHAFASVLVDELVPITDIAHALGHASPAVTMAIYAHKLGKKPNVSAAIMDGLVQDSSENKSNLP